MSAIVERFPASWRTQVMVDRPGGKDAKGNALPSTQHVVMDCLMDIASTEDELKLRTDSPETSIWLRTRPGADFAPQDQVTVPAGPLWPHGRFLVDGEPKFGPLGTSVPLRRI